MPAASPGPFRVHGRLVDPSLNRVTTPTGETVQVEPKIMQVLLTLSERPEEVVTREELMSRVWNGVFVSDDALHRAIRELRKLFDDEPESPKVIETIRKRGYRLIAKIERRNGMEPAGAKEKAVAVRRQTAAAAALIAALAGTLFLTFGRKPAATPSGPSVRFTPLTSEPGNELDPALSANGRLAYVARSSDGRAHVFARTSADSAAVQLTRGEATDRSPAWSPDESRLAFVRMDANGCAIWIAAADGRETRKLGPCTATDEFRMSWSPAADLLAVTAGATTVRSPSHIEVIDIRTGAHRSVTEAPPAHSGDWSPSFSPDGTQIAFVRSIAGSISDIFTVPTAGGAAARRVTADNADVLGVDWEPDGRHLVFSSDRAGGISVWRVEAEGGHEPVLLAGGGAKLKHPTVARRAGTVAYEDWQYEINLREVSTVDDESHATIAISPTSDRWNFHPQISPDSRRLVFQSTRSGQYELWISDRDGGNARPLTRSGVYKSPARWAPDARRIAFTMRTHSATEIAVLNVDDGAAQTIASEGSAAVAPAWSADGTSIYYGSLRSGTWQIWNVEVSSGRTRQVTTDGGYAALESADGRWLYVARLDRPGLSKRPVAGGAETVVADRVLAEQWPNWGLYDGGLYYLTWPDDGDPCVALLEESRSTSHGPRLLTRLPEYAWTGIALTRDAARVIYAHADRRSSNIGALQIQR
jgi:Tol biopolymer transport system component/DNA-binding winged helix-turn-helix (wHTH) protein